jgi:hypothetical protein
MQTIEENNQLTLFSSQDGNVTVDVKIGDETVWLTQKQIAELFGKATPTINEHIKNIYLEEELDERSTIRKFRIVQSEGDRTISRDIDHYNLDMIISVGYRVKSKRGIELLILKPMKTLVFQKNVPDCAPER